MAEPQEGWYQTSLISANGTALYRQARFWIRPHWNEWKLHCHKQTARTLKALSAGSLLHAAAIELSATEAIAEPGSKPESAVLRRNKQPSLCFPTVKCATLGGSSVNWRLDMYPAFIPENTFEEKLIIAMNDLKFAFRQLLKNPGFSAVAVLTLALGIGATTAIYSAVQTTLIDPLPVKDADRLMSIESFNAL